MTKTTHNPESINLADVLGAKVEASNVRPVFNLEDENNSNPPQFDEATEVLEENQVIQEGRSQRPPVDEGYMPPEHIAETIVNLLDGLQTTVVPYLREKKIFNEQELEILQRIDRSGNTVYQPDNSPENRVLAKWTRHQEIVKLIPFDEGEKSRLVHATARYAETTQMKVSPLSGLMMAYSEVILKRSAYFFSE